MKSINVNPVKIATVLVLSFSLVLTSFTASANGDERKKSEIPVDLTYVGSVNSNPVFQLDLVNDDQEKLNISIRTLAGDILYATSFKGKAFSQKIRFDNIDHADMQLKLVVTSKTKSETQNFEIKYSNKVVEEISVGKL